MLVGEGTRVIFLPTTGVAHGLARSTTKTTRGPVGRIGIDDAVAFTSWSIGPDYLRTSAHGPQVVPVPISTHVRRPADNQPPVGRHRSTRQTDKATDGRRYVSGRRFAAVTLQTVDRKRPQRPRYRRRRQSCAGYCCLCCCAPPPRSGAGTSI